MNIPFGGPTIRQFQALMSINCLLSIYLDSLVSRIAIFLEERESTVESLNKFKLTVVNIKIKEKVLV